VVYSGDSKPIKVGAVFKSSKIIPKWFIWEDRKYNIKSIDYLWQDKQGSEKIVRFSVSDGINSYELAYYASKTIWKLEKIA
jgi:hypothetical protein